MGESNATLLDISAFERRLTLRETQQNLDKKLGATEFSGGFVKNVLHDALVEVETTANEGPMKINKPITLAESLKRQKTPPRERVVFTGAVGDGTGRQAPRVDEVEPLPPLRLLHITRLHGSNLRGPTYPWKRGIEALMCHPFCQIRVDSQQLRTPTQRASRNPVWGGGKMFLGPTATVLTVEVFSEEKDRADTLIGHTQVELSQFQMGLQEQLWLPLQGGAEGQSLQMELKLTVYDLESENKK